MCSINPDDWATVTEKEMLTPVALVMAEQLN
jgi:hypothetical protein